MVGSSESGRETRRYPQFGFASYHASAFQLVDVSTLPRAKCRICDLFSDK
ncbi:MAG: hypothetical protein ACLT0Y_01825 [Christensenellales bacterium]